MSNYYCVRPEDLLPDDVDSATVNGRVIRKGTVAAFLANVEIFENPNIELQQKQEVFAAMKELAPAVVTVGLHKHVIFRNPEIEQILVDAECVTY